MAAYWEPVDVQATYTTACYTIVATTDAITGETTHGAWGWPRASAWPVGPMGPAASEGVAEFIELSRWPDPRWAWRDFVDNLYLARGERPAPRAPDRSDKIGRWLRVARRPPP